MSTYRGKALFWFTVMLGRSQVTAQATSNYHFLVSTDGRSYLVSTHRTITPVFFFCSLHPPVRSASVPFNIDCLPNDKIECTTGRKTPHITHTFYSFGLTLSEGFPPLTKDNECSMIVAKRYIW